MYTTIQGIDIAHGRRLIVSMLLHRHGRRSPHYYYFYYLTSVGI